MQSTHFIIPSRPCLISGSMTFPSASVTLQMSNAASTWIVIVKIYAARSSHSITGEDGDRRLTVFSAKCLPGQILRYFSYLTFFIDRTIPYRRPNPNAILLGSLGIRSPGLRRKRSGMKISGFGYSTGSCSIALIATPVNAHLQKLRTHSPMVRNDGRFRWNKISLEDVILFRRSWNSQWYSRMPS